MSKITAYQELVRKRKGFKFSHPELTNPSSTAFDLDHVEPWAQWQGNLDASIVVVGQEFCDVDTYARVKGTVERKLGVYEYPANRNLVEYFSLLNMDLGHPLDPMRKHHAFFTNVVMGLKPPPMSSNFKDKWLKESREEFLTPCYWISSNRRSSSALVRSLPRQLERSMVSPLDVMLTW